MKPQVLNTVWPFQEGCRKLAYVPLLCLIFAAWPKPAAGSDSCNCPDPLLTNPGFEQGTNGWHSAGGTFIATTNGGACGKRTALLDARSSRVRVWQPLSHFPANGQLKLSFLATTAGESSTAPLVKLACYNQADSLLRESVRKIIPATTPQTHLAEYTILIVPPSGTTRIVIEAIAVDGQLLLDGFCLLLLPNEQPVLSALNFPDIEGPAIDDHQPDKLLINGRIRTPYFTTVTGAGITIEGEPAPRTISGPEGTFTLEWSGRNNIPLGIIPRLDTDHRAEITARDLLLLQKILVGDATFASPYQMLAADVNNSQSVTTSDLIILRKLVRGKIKRFPLATNWLFVPAGHQFMAPHNPWFRELPGRIEVFPGQAAVEVEFIGIRIGDLDVFLQSPSAAVPQSPPSTAIHRDRLYQNQPNPFAATTTIGFNLVQSGQVKLRILDSRGNPVRVWHAILENGYQEFHFQREHLPAGHYYYQLETGRSAIIKKLVIVN